MESRLLLSSGDTFVTTHCWWHLALFRLARGRVDDALALYDTHIRTGRSRSVADMIDASALLWRLHLIGADVGARWEELADCWAPRAQDAFCAFSDLHAMMAFVAAQREDCAARLLAAQVRRIAGGGTNAVMTRLVGLPACRALHAFARASYRHASDALGGCRRLRSAWAEAASSEACSSSLHGRPNGACAARVWSARLQRLPRLVTLSAELLR